MADATRLYSTAVLALATRLAEWPWDDSLPLQASVRSRSCGSTLDLGLAMDQGAIARIGVRAQACAIGQASAAILAGEAIGRSGQDIARVVAQVESWLNGGPLPDWPDFAAIAPARDYPGRHGAILLPWQAARELLPTG